MFSTKPNTYLLIGLILLLFAVPFDTARNVTNFASQIMRLGTSLFSQRFPWSTISVFSDGNVSGGCHLGYMYNEITKRKIRLKVADIVPLSKLSR